jgi:hypothetical protein
MSVALTTLRTTIAEALQDDSKWQTFAFPPATIMANSVIVSWDDPMLSPSNGHYASIAPMANFKILMTVPLFDNVGALQGIEDTIVSVFNKLSDSSLVFTVGTVSAPGVLNAASGDLLTSEISISILTSWS